MRYDSSREMVSDGILDVSLVDRARVSDVGDLECRGTKVSGLSQWTKGGGMC